MPNSQDAIHDLPPDNGLFALSLALLELIDREVAIELEQGDNPCALVLQGTLLRAFDTPSTTATPSISLMTGAHSITIRLGPIRRIAYRHKTLPIPASKASTSTSTTTTHSTSNPSHKPPINQTNNHPKPNKKSNTTTIQPTTSPNYINLNPQTLQTHLIMLASGQLPKPAPKPLGEPIGSERPIRLPSRSAIAVKTRDPCPQREFDCVLPARGQLRLATNTRLLGGPEMSPTHRPKGGHAPKAGKIPTRLVGAARSPSLPWQH